MMNIINLNRTNMVTDKFDLHTNYVIDLGKRRIRFDELDKFIKNYTKSSHNVESFTLLSIHHTLYAHELLSKLNTISNYGVFNNIRVLTIYSCIRLDGFLRMNINKLQGLDELTLRSDRGAYNAIERFYMKLPSKLKKLNTNIPLSTSSYLELEELNELVFNNVFMTYETIDIFLSKLNNLRHIGFYSELYDLNTMISIKTHQPLIEELSLDMKDRVLNKYSDILSILPNLKIINCIKTYKDYVEHYKPQFLNNWKIMRNIELVRLEDQQLDRLDLIKDVKDKCKAVSFL